MIAEAYIKALNNTQSHAGQGKKRFLNLGSGAQFFSSHAIYLEPGCRVTLGISISPFVA
jgi:hypothetical protein